MSALTQVHASKVGGTQQLPQRPRRHRLGRPRLQRSAGRDVNGWEANVRACVLPAGEPFSCWTSGRALEGGIVARLPAANGHDWWSRERGGAPGNSNRRGGSKEAAEATRDGGGDRRYVSPAWAGRRGLAPGGVTCQYLIRAPGIVPGGARGHGERWESRAGQPTSLFSLFLLTGQCTRLET